MVDYLLHWSGVGDAIDGNVGRTLKEKGKLFHFFILMAPEIRQTNMIYIIGLIITIDIISEMRS